MEWPENSYGCGWYGAEEPHKTHKGSESPSTPCYAIFKAKSGAELAVLLCPACGYPRFADYACDTCKKREYEEVLKRIASRTQDTDLLWWQKEARAALDA